MANDQHLSPESCDEFEHEFKRKLKHDKIPK